MPGLELPDTSLPYREPIRPPLKPPKPDPWKVYPPADEGEALIEQMAELLIHRKLCQDDDCSRCADYYAAKNAIQRVWSHAQATPTGSAE